MGRHSGQRISRRALLRGGGASAGLAALAGLGVLPGAARAQSSDDERRRPNVVLIVADRLRSDYIGAYDDVFDDRKTSTPNIDALAKQSLRFRYATPDAMPALPMRRGLLTGMRSYPFRDWRAVPGIARVPGYSRIYPFQPLLPELTAAAGVETVWVTDNPTLTGRRFGFVRRTHRIPSAADYVPTERDYLLPLGGPVQRRRVEPTSRVLKVGMELVDQLKGRQPFFLALDAFDLADAYLPPRQYVAGRGPVDGEAASVPRPQRWQETVAVEADGDVVREVRERYAAEVRAVDGWVGRFLDKLDDAGLADDTVVIFVGDGGLALGEQALFGHPAGSWHRRVYHVPLMIRDPERRWAGDTSSWFVSTFDIPTTILSYLDITVPGKMRGEDLTTLLDHFDLPGRPYFTTASDVHVVTGDRRFLLIGRTDQDRWRLYEAEDEDKPDEIRNETVKSPTVLETLRRYALVAAGGTLPEFGDDATRQPPEPRGLSRNVADDGTLDEDEREANELR